MPNLSRWVDHKHHHTAQRLPLLHLCDQHTDADADDDHIHPPNCMPGHLYPMSLLDRIHC